MIWHIFKKDVRHLWLSAVCFGALDLVLSVARLSLGRFYQARLALAALDASTFMPGRQIFLATGLPAIALLGSALLIIAIVQQDAIPGLRQDWLVRPIRRRDLLLAKVVGVLVMAQGPIFLADLVETLGSGFSWTQSLGAALARGIVVVFAFRVPLLAFASLTKNNMEAIAGGVVITLGASLLTMVTMPDGVLGPVTVAWVTFAVRTGILVAGAAVLLGIQYFWRKTMVSRWVTVGVGLLYWLIPPVPWQTAFALEQRLSPNPGAGNPIAINFVPDRSALADRQVGPGNSRAFGSVFVLLPIRATGVPEPSILLADASTARVITPDGQVHKIGGQGGFKIWKEQAGEGEEAFTYGIRLAPELYRRVADQPLRVEIDYSLTLMGLRESQTLPANGGDVRSAGMGWCGTTVDRDGLQILFGCLRAGNPDWCTSVVLEAKALGARNHRGGACQPSYSPFRSNLEGDVLGRAVFPMPFADPSIGDPTLVTPAMLSQATVTARSYEVRDHFVRQLVIPQIRLRDWATE